MYVEKSPEALTTEQTISTTSAHPHIRPEPVPITATPTASSHQPQVYLTPTHPPFCSLPSRATTDGALTQGRGTPLSTMAGQSQSGQ